ncbi:MAG: hypothetical protein PHO91_02190 [Patescibacteria group bacterium]|nr:hypothetical protein [Patescibacteria group bacterium]
MSKYREEPREYQLNPKSQLDASGQVRICSNCGAPARYEYSRGCMVFDCCDGDECRRFVLQDLRSCLARIFP